MDSSNPSSENSADSRDAISELQTGDPRLYEIECIDCVVRISKSDSIGNGKAIKKWDISASKIAGGA